jgi:hypothetical protein
LPQQNNRDPNLQFHCFFAIGRALYEANRTAKSDLTCLENALKSHFGLAAVIISLERIFLFRVFI